MYIRRGIAPSTAKNVEEANMINYVFGQKNEIEQNKKLEDLLKEIPIWEQILSEIFSHLAFWCCYRGYHGYKRMFRYISKLEFIESLDLKEFLVDMLYIEPIEGHSIAGELNFKNIQDIIKYAADCMQNSLERLNYIQSRVCDEGEYIVVPKINEMIKKTSYFLNKLRREYQELENAGFNAIYIQEKSQILHEKYKKKEEKIVF